MNAKSGQPASNSRTQQEFLRVFLANEREIYRYVAALVPPTADAQEIVQQTAVVLWEKFDQYDAARQFAPWACRFALNIARPWMARRQRWKALLDGGLAEELALRREELRAEFDARLVHLDHCMEKLPEKQRALVDGYYFRRHRAIQRFTLYGFSGDQLPDMTLPPHRTGWERIARVNTDKFFQVHEPLERPSQQACSITSPHGEIGRFRYLLWEIDGGTFFGEFDVFGESHE